METVRQQVRSSFQSFLKLPSEVLSSLLPSMPKYWHYVGAGCESIQFVKRLSGKCLPYKVNHCPQVSDYGIQASWTVCYITYHFWQCEPNQYLLLGDGASRLPQAASVARGTYFTSTGYSKKYDIYREQSFKKKIKKKEKTGSPTTPYTHIYISILGTEKSVTEFSYQIKSFVH